MIFTSQAIKTLNVIQQNISDSLKKYLSFVDYYSFKKSHSNCYIEPENKTEKTTLNIFLLLRVISLFTRWFSHFRNSNMIKLEKSMEKEESD